MDDFCNLLATWGLPSSAIRVISWLVCALMLFLGIYGMGYTQGRFNYIAL